MIPNIDDRETPYGRAILFALQRKTHVFTGLWKDEAKVGRYDSRRAKNRLARASRRRNRKA